MSSGDRAKPTSHEERNPFDISRRSERDVAAEIAQRLAAWKQARGRSYATPSAATGETKQAPLAAPVQPARLPKFAEPVARAQQPAHAPRTSQIDSRARTTRSATESVRAPLFASASAISRAMPPAPSLKRPAALPEPQLGNSRVEPLDAAPKQVSAPPPETLLVARPSVEIPDVVAEAPAARISDVGSAPTPCAATEIENGVAAPTPEMPVEEAQEFRGVADAPLIAEVIEHQIEARAADTPTQEPLEVTSLNARPTGSTIAEPSVDEPVAPVTDVADEDTLSIDASVSERLERESSPPALTSAPDEEPELALSMGEPIAEPPAAPEIEELDDGSRATESPNIAAAEVDEPIEQAQPAERAAPVIESSEAPESEGRPSEAHDIEPTSEPAISRELVARRSDMEIAPLAATRAEAPDLEPRIAARKIELPSIETRIESRRIDILRADPLIAGRQPIFPHIDQEAWDVPPPMVAHHATQSRGGTGWAIGLGALLLIAGLTAPAAIWQGRQQTPVDQVVALVPAPEPPVGSETRAQTQPQPEMPQAAATQPSAPSNIQAQLPPAPPAQPDVGVPAPRQQAAVQAALGAVGDGGEVERAPIAAPPPEGSATTVPKPVNKNTVSKAGVQPQVAAAEAPAFPPVAHPFIPEPGLTPTPFRPAAGNATVPIDGAIPASIGLKPSIVAQLKPYAAAPSAKPVSSAPQKTARKPKAQDPRSLDQMFQTLIDTLSQGQPINSANKPIPPSTRK